MGTYRIFCRPMQESAKLDNNTHYKFEENRLRVDWNGRTLYYGNVKEDAAFYVKTKREAPPTVAFLTPPKSSADFIGWLAGFNARQRATNADEYERAYICEAIRRPWMKRVDFSGRSWRYTLGIDQKGRKHFVCVLINRNISKEQTMEFFRSIWTETTPRYPSSYCRKLLKERIGLTDEEYISLGLSNETEGVAC